MYLRASFLLLSSFSFALCAACSPAPHDPGIDDGGSWCGNGVVEAPEACDDGNAEDGDGCSADCLSAEYCGNAIVDMARGEICDDGNTTSGDGCASDCRSAEACGNGIIDVATGEVCDDGNTAGGDGCAADCKSTETCGNGITDTAAGEACDDGNKVDTDACRSNCALASCGDGLVEADVEACDDGRESAACDLDCTPPACGDGQFNASAGEVCDDGNVIAGDGCSANCLSAETCGNGIVDVDEVCDDGNNADADGCSADCLSSETCGNGFVDLNEVCDDGGNVNGDGCASDCQSNETCGNGILDTAAGEVCDDGNTSGGDGCSTDCHSNETCGNAFVDPDEDCDDANGSDNDDCRNDCRWNVCGDGLVDSGGSNFEACDDGNTVDEIECPYGQGTCTVCNSDCTATFNFTGPVCGDGQVDPAHEACDDGNVNACGLCSLGCNAVQGTPAKGTLTAVGYFSLSDGEIFTVGDGVNPPVLFEFDVQGNGVAIGHTSVSVYSSYSASDVAAAIVVAINGIGTRLTVSAANSGATVSLTNDAPGAFGNQPIFENVQTQSFAVSGMALGTGFDCARGIACTSNGDCMPGSTCDTVRHSCQPSCAVDNDCSPGEACDLSTATCARACTFNSDCLNGDVCDPSNQTCVPGP